MGIPRPWRANAPGGTGRTSLASQAPDTPYLGLRTFGQTDQDTFFGRAVDADAIAQHWRANPLTIVAGPVASGKSSLLQAGVYPLMSGRRWDILPPGRLSYEATFPFGALRHYNSYTLGLLRSWLPDEVATRLAGLTVREFVRIRSQRHSGIVFAAIDHADDLFSDSGSGRRVAWRRQFLGDLAHAIRDEPRLHLLLVVRSESVEKIRQTLGNGALYEVSALTVAGALDAVTGPASRVGRTFADGAAEKLVAELRNGANLVEPALLQIVCSRLWRSIPPEVLVITPHHVRAFGDADTALAEYCGQAIAAVSTEHDLTTKRLHAWVCNAFITKLATRGSVYEGATRTNGMPNAVARRLVDCRLLTTELRSGLRLYQLLSDRLIKPLRQAADEPPPPPAEPASTLRAAERGLTQGELDVAEQYAEQVMRTTRDFRLCARAQSLLGNLAFERDEPALAVAHYRDAANLFEAARDTGACAQQLAAVGQMLLAQGETANAVAELEAAIRRMPGDLLMQTELATALWQLGEGRAAVAVLTSILAIDGGNTDALQARGEILADLGDAREAMLDLDRQRGEGNPAVTAARGLALAGLGDYPAAQREADDAVAKAPRNGPVLLYAARTFALGGQETFSGELARRAIDATNPPLSPAHREVALRLATPR
jgi:tetratricopeptide (TPR) repeat protein